MGDRRAGVPQQTRKPQRKKPPVKVKQVAAPKVKERLAKFDVPFFIIVLVLIVFGAGMLLSASFSFAAREHGDSYHYFIRQIGFIGAGMVVMIALSFVPYSIFMNRLVVFLIAGVSFSLMVAVWVGGIEQGGAVRWLSIGGITFQPSEVLKFALIVVMAFIVQRNPEGLRRFGKGFVPFVAVIGVACGLMVFQKHLSGTIIIFTIGAVLLMVSPVRTKHIFFAAVLLVAMVIAALPIVDSMSDATVEERIQSWREPESDIQGATFQTYQSLITIGSGGWFGLGLGNSRQKFAYLPASHNDFIFSVIVEELGFVGGILVLLMFVIFMLKGFHIASRAPDRFGMMLAVGITAQISIQAFLNIAVATNSVPNTGILLPFFSYGGTAMLVQMAQIGILLNISRKARIE
jgi:cell division protein FtsW